MNKIIDRIIDEIAKNERKHHGFRVVFGFFRYCRYKYSSFKVYISSIFRVVGLRDRKFEKLLKYKNRYKGERCFIVATGPSLTIDDLEKIKNEHTFSMNSIVLAYEETAFRPEFYGIQDRNVYQRLYDYIVKYSKEQIIFYSYGLRKANKECNDEYEERFRPLNEWIPIQINGYYHMYDFTYNCKWHTRFHRNVYAYAYDGYSITYTLIELAIYMGFTEIYLLGCDSNYSSNSGKQHFKEHGIIDPDRYKETAHERLDCAYLKAKEYADKHHVRIFNATRGGMLEVFPRVNIDDLLS